MKTTIIYLAAAACMSLSMTYMTPTLFADETGKYYEYEKNPFNPANKYDPKNPLGPAEKYNPKNPFNPARKYDPDNPLRPAGKYDPDIPLKQKD